MATIRKRGNRWQCIVKRQGHPTHAQSFELKKDAEKWGRQQERLIDTGEWSDRIPVNQTTLKELLERYSLEISPTKRGKEIELIRLRRFMKSSLAKLPLSSISSQRVALWRDERLTEVSSATVLRELQLLGHVFSVAGKEWNLAIQGNPVGLIRKPVSGKARDRVLTDDERIRLLESCQQCRNPWIKPIVIFALETASRRGEILALTWGAVNLDRGFATLSVTKTGEPRKVPLSPACITMLRALERSPDGRVFPVTIETLKQAYQRAVLRAGITNFTFHDLRHDALTRLAKLGLSVLELRAISGHATANMLQRYVSIDASDLAMKIAGASI